MGEHYYNLPGEQVLESLQARLEGLHEQEVKHRRARYGHNALPEEKKFSIFGLLIQQFKSTLTYILLIAAGISFLLGDIVDMWVILAAVILNVIVGFIQEFRAQRTLEKLRKVVTSYTSVKRGGHEHKIESDELVPGDIVILRAGDKVPADIRILKQTDLKIDEASLTGESFPIEKTTDALPSAVILAERKNMAFMGTTVVTGSATGVVTATADQTELGHIARLIKTTEQEETPLQHKLSRLAKWLGIIILILSAIIFALGLVLGYDIREIFTTAVALSVAAIPEGLVVVVTVILAIGMQRILRQHALVRKLVAAETLGSTTVICTDKTGTLTEGEMRVVRIITHDKKLDSTKHTEPGTAEAEPVASYFAALKTGVLASDAYIENPDEAMEHRTVIGMPTEKAIVMAASQAGIDLDKLRAENPRLEVVPFSSERKFMATLNQNTKKEKTIYCKGAPEVILRHTTRIDLDGKIDTLDSKKRDKLRREYETLSSQGMRLLAFSYKQVAQDYAGIEEDEKLLNDMVFVGFAVIKDPLREGAKETIETCLMAGIRPVMITGDHRLTAQAIAKELGLLHEDDNIIEGDAFATLNEDELRDRIAVFSVYARVSPKDKLRIIDAWQHKDEVVAMTGDGVNDAPALKSADIGVALGSGTDVAKETADMVLLDNNFKTIVAAVEQGRIIYENIKKVILYLLSDSFTEMVIIVGALSLGWPLPLLAAQILWINLITDGFPNIALTFEPGDKNIMQQPPVSSKTPILDKEIKIIVVIVSLVTGVIALGVFYWFWQMTGDLDKARTMVFTAIAVDSLFYVFSCRSLKNPIYKIKFFSNKYLIASVIMAFALQLVAIYTPFFQNIFKVTPLNLSEWVLVFIYGTITIITTELIKYLYNKFTGRDKAASYNHGK